MIQSKGLSIKYIRKTGLLTPCLSFVRISRNLSTLFIYKISQILNPFSLGADVLLKCPYITRRLHLIVCGDDEPTEGNDGVAERVEERHAAREPLFGVVAVGDAAH